MLVKILDTYINPNNITHIRKLHNITNIYFNCADTEDRCNSYISFHKDHITIEQIVDLINKGRKL